MAGSPETGFQGKRSLKAIMSPSDENPRRKRAANTGPKGLGHFDPSGRQTLADQIYEQLHHEITQLVLKPGTPILEREIATRFDASRTPVREAVLRLAREMLVEVLPKSGTFVARIPLSALPEALVARRAIECDLVARAAKLASPAKILRLRAIIEEGREAAASGSQAEFDKTDSAFHAEIAAISGYPGLWKLVLQVKTPTDRFRHMVLPVADRMQQVVSEHEGIADAIERGDAVEAAECMESHLNQLKTDTLHTIERHPEYFVYDIDLDSLKCE
ncbi:GntR family transcriptional regulator [Ruegeria sp. ANG-R]|uniref:GntR family transcriptional regulator n=1 Tax=Ruegeria sp. ANG-R TaxID=1577903 RepID=UPI0006898BDE|nr:GntR family transcriptional regulator [Ruegeria sp. ANG-R]